jgi:hypothetical protein
MAGLELPTPKPIDVAVAVNRRLGLAQAGVPPKRATRLPTGAAK